MLETLYPYIHIAGRVMFSMIFIGSGIMGHFVQMNDTIAYYESRGLKNGKPAVIGSGLIILAGGLMVLTGWHRFVGAGLLILFLLPAAFLIHCFWKDEDPHIQALEMANFMKNLSMAGAALLIAYYAGEVWPFSL